MLIPQICRASLCRYIIIIILLGNHVSLKVLDLSPTESTVMESGVWTSFLNALRNESNNTKYDI